MPHDTHKHRRGRLCHTTRSFQGAANGPLARWGASAKILSEGTLGVLPAAGCQGIILVRRNSTANPTFRVETLGCKANRYDSQRLAEALLRLGYVQAGDAKADLCIINTCTVTDTCDRKCRKLIRRTIKDNPGARVLVSGCYATSSPEELTAIDGVEGVYGRDEWAEMMRAIGGPAAERVQLGGDFGIQSFNGRARAFLKVQEGCDAFCSYCILPYVRGRARSRPLPDVVEEARRLAGTGFREIVLTGINLGLYGRDLEGRVQLADAVVAVADVEGIERVRASSVEVGEVGERLLEAMRHPRVCPHLHVPLQSGDNDVLRRMNRHYSATEFLDTVELARERLDDPAITTDVMVAFPGETDEQFENTVRACRKAAFSRIHVFPFSPRPGTTAATMGGRIDSRVVKSRANVLGGLARALAEQWAESFVGQKVSVLFEEVDGEGNLAGYTERYVKAHAAGSGTLCGRAVQIVCTRAEGPELVGEFNHDRPRSP